MGALAAVPLVGDSIGIFLYLTQKVPFRFRFIASSPRAISTHSTAETLPVEPDVNERGCGLPDAQHLGDAEGWGRE